jgi:hypothetical protein
VAGALLTVLMAGDLLIDDRLLPPLLNKEGVAGCFAGASHGSLLVAGGANFPGKKPWEGGAKVWHDDASTSGHGALSTESVDRSRL